VKLDQYSSVAAFLVHWRALSRARNEPLNSDEAARRTEMDRIIGALRPEERAALEKFRAGSPAADERSPRRHRERAETDLARELRLRGLLQD